MHIPDGILSGAAAGGAALAAAGGVGWALWRARGALPARKAPLLGLSAAFVFAGQMINFPVGPGVSGHLVGAALVTALLGPAAAVIALTAVLVLQAFLFADGGVLALGANVFNMAVLGPAAAWAVAGPAGVLWPGARGKVAGAALGGWAATVLAAMACAGELAVSGVASWGLLAPVMLYSHLAIGLGEAVITGLVLGAIARSRPELLVESTKEMRPAGMYRKVIAAGLLGIVGLAVMGAPLASELPDGLEYAAAKLGLKGPEATTAAGTAVAAEYQVPGISSRTLGMAVAGGIGTVAAFGVAWGMGAKVGRSPEEAEGSKAAKGSEGS